MGAGKRRKKKIFRHRIRKLSYWFPHSDFQELLFKLITTVYSQMAVQLGGGAQGLTISFQHTCRFKETIKGSQNA